MSFEAALYYEIAHNSDALVSVVGTGAYPIGELPQGTARPHLTWQRIDSIRHYTQTDGSTVEARYQFNCVADSRNAARALAATVREKFSRYRDAAMGGGAATAKVHLVVVEDERDDFEGPTDATERGPQAVTVDLIFFYEE